MNHIQLFLSVPVSMKRGHRVQAIEAKEGVTINNETVTLASVSYQNFFRSYPKLSGMSGTAATEIDEFSNIYDMSVQARPPG